MKLVDALYGNEGIVQKADRGNAIDAADSRQAQLIECKADRLGMRASGDLAAGRIELGGGGDDRAPAPSTSGNR